MRSTAVQVNWVPPRPITDREREVLARVMLREADSLIREWDTPIIEADKEN